MEGGREGEGSPDTVVAMLMTPVPRRACGAAADRPGARCVSTERHFDNIFWSDSPHNN